MTETERCTREGTSCIAFPRNPRGEVTIAARDSRKSRITDVTGFLDVDAKDNSQGTILCLLEEREKGSSRRLCRLNWKMLISIQPRRDIPCRASESLGFLRLLSPSPFSPTSHARTPFATLPSIRRDEIKAREGKFCLRPPTARRPTTSLLRRTIDQTSIDKK